VTLQHVDHFNAAGIEKVASCDTAVQSQLSILLPHAVSLTPVLIENLGGKFSSIFQRQATQKGKLAVIALKYYPIGLNYRVFPSLVSGKHAPSIWSGSRSSERDPHDGG
jgi:hypothetical protein